MSSRPLLPQSDPNPAARQRALEQARAAYQYDQTIVPPLQLAHEVPETDTPSAKWISKAGVAAAKIGLNLLANKSAWLAGDGPLFFGEGPGESPEQAAIEAEREKQRAFLEEVAALEEEEAAMAEGPMAFGLFDNPLFEEVTERVFHILGARYIDPNAPVDPWISPATPNGRPESTEDYTALFRTLSPPDQVRTYQTDAAFCRARVAGPNARQIRRVEALPENFPVTEAHFALGAPGGDTLAAALSEGRVFMCDYAVLGEVLEPNVAPDGALKFVHSPMALFAVPPGGGALWPVAIQCSQAPDPEESPVITPDQGWRWRMARYIVECADANVHEVVAHLAMTHLRTEPIVLATARQLAPNHPLSVLLRTHFEGTLSINSAAASSMIAPKGAVDRIFAGTLDSTIRLGAQAILKPDYLDRMLPRDLVLRGVDDPEIIRDYPYRDDAQRLWAAIDEWVGEYVGLYYESDAAVAEDTELAAWVQTLRQPVEEGGIAGFPLVGDRAGLVGLLTYIIFTVSAEHAAVNFPQWTDMAYAPALSGACWAPAPKASSPASEQAFLDLLPPLQLAELQLEFLNLLGGMYFTQLGDYRANRWPYGSALKDPAVAPALGRFRAALNQVEAEISAVNANPALRAVPYTHLLPSRIPQSINI